MPLGQADDLLDVLIAAARNEVDEAIERARRMRETAISTPSGMSFLLLPAGTPKALVNKISAEVRRILALPDIRQRVTDLGFDVIASTPEQFSAQVRFEIERWGKVIKAAGIKAE